MISFPYVTLDTGHPLLCFGKCHPTAPSFPSSVARLRSKTFTSQKHFSLYFSAMSFLALFLCRASFPKVFVLFFCEMMSRCIFMQGIFSESFRSSFLRRTCSLYFYARVSDHIMADPLHFSGFTSMCSYFLQCNPNCFVV